MANTISAITGQDDHCRTEIQLATDGTNFNLIKYSSLDNFDSEQIISITNSSSGTKYYYDYLVEPGVLYKYRYEYILTNILGSDGNFENGSVAPLTASGSATISSTQSMSGGNSLKVTASANTAFAYKDYTSQLQSTKYYLLGAWVYIESRTSGGIYVTLSDAVSPFTARYTASANISTIGSWQFIYVKVPTSNTISGTGFRLLVGATTASSTITAYIDSIRLYEVDSVTYSAIGSTITTTSSPAIYDVFPYTSTTYNARIPFQSDSPVFLGSTGSYILGKGNIQLNLIYNGSISDFKKIKKDSIIETIGGSYPFVVRGSNTNYKQFGFSGAIVANIDNELFLSGGTYSYLISGTSNVTTDSLYTTKYKNVYSPNSNQNFVLEKFFRKKVLDWLNDGNVKVFKTDTEDMVVGRITEVSLSPMDGTSRIIYQVSFTFTEIDSISNASKYNLYSTSLYSTQLTSIFENNSF